jgi:hypothetical protein
MKFNQNFCENLDLFVVLEVIVIKIIFLIDPLLFSDSNRESVTVVRLDV